MRIGGGVGEGLLTMMLEDDVVVEDKYIDCSMGSDFDGGSVGIYQA